MSVGGAAEAARGMMGSMEAMAIEEDASGAATLIGGRCASVGTGAAGAGRTIATGARARTRKQGAAPDGAADARRRLQRRAAGMVRRCSRAARWRAAALLERPYWALDSGDAADTNGQKAGGFRHRLIKEAWCLKAVAAFPNAGEAAAAC